MENSVVKRRTDSAAINKQFSKGTISPALTALFFLLVVFIHQPSSAQVRFSASAPNSIPENQNLNLTFTLESANGSNLRLPPMSDFSLLGGPSTSTSMQIINGSVTQSA